MCVSFSRGHIYLLKLRSHPIPASMASSLCHMQAAVAAGPSSRKPCYAALSSTSTVSVSPQLRGSASIRLRRPFFFGSDPANPLICSSKVIHTCTSSRHAAVVQPSASANGTATTQGLAIDLRGKRAFIAGVADDQGYGWAIAKALAAAGAEILVGTWVPALNIFETSLRRGKFDASRVLPNGSLMEIAKVYPLDAVFDNMDDVPEDIKSNKRYAGHIKWTVQEVAESVKEDYGTIDILVHSLANGPEVTKPLLETSRRGYLAAISASSYSYVSLLKHFAPLMNAGGSSLSLTYIASEKIIPGYGGGMSSAKAALESDTRVLAFEAGRKHKIRVNTISAGPLRSRAAKAIGFIDDMINYSLANAPLQKDLEADDIGNAAAFLSSPLAGSITGSVVYIDNGLHAMGLATDSPALSQAIAAVPEKSNVVA